MCSDYTISVDNVSKQYDLYKSPLQRVRGLLLGRRQQQETFTALKPLSLKIRRGSFFGIIGQNGSGKSTLLQIISGILQPSSGHVTVYGRIAALLELGAGFNPEFTGRENARLNAQILGVSGKDFDRILPEIEAFADIGEFIDSPVKTYSSGMFVRLAFAVQACIDPDVLIVDEALAVGDIFFRLKCYERLERLRQRGCTVILVTHSMDDVMHYCDEVLLLHHGNVVYQGDATEAINRYYALGHINAKKMLSDDARRLNESAAHLDDAQQELGDTQFRWPENAGMDMSSREQTGDGLVRCIRMAITDEFDDTRQVFRQFEKLRIYAEFMVHEALETPVIGFVLRTDRGVVIHGKNSGQCGTPVPSRLEKGSTVRASFDIPLAFATGEYVLDVGFATWPRALHRNLENSSMAEIESTSSRHCVITNASSFSIVPQGHMGFQAQPFYGVAGVDSSARICTES
ncbi:ABC transporter ATP-binding protein [Pseudomonas sp. PDM18]|uniref:ABC transporter ATP-binding protein n=1 Tax=unclassified Pseudomonas TaxID=196821 RepID=UPI0017813673|nr:ABC transporter ATP-binding protein [Pseudomonas sp. PDM18]MBD9678447.1 ABC transporter ATP-binding protein [Pseudomonas sp. PDM18]